MPPALSFARVCRRFGRLAVLGGVSGVGGGGRGPAGHRPQRLRQEHAAAVPGRPAGAGLRDHRLLRGREPAERRRAPPPHRPGGARPRLLRRADRGREPRLLLPPAWPGARARRRSAAAPRAAARSPRRGALVGDAAAPALGLGAAPPAAPAAARRALPEPRRGRRGDRQPPARRAPRAPGRGARAGSAGRHRQPRAPGDRPCGGQPRPGRAEAAAVFAKEWRSELRTRYALNTLGALRRHHPGGGERQPRAAGRGAQGRRRCCRCCSG